MHMFGVDADRIRFKTTLLSRLKCVVVDPLCFSHNHNFDLVVVRQTLAGQCYIDDILP